MGASFSSRVFIDDNKVKSLSHPLPSLSSLSSPLSSFANRLRVYQNFETNEVVVLIDSDITEFPGFSKSEAEEWYEVTVSRLQEKYFEQMQLKEEENESPKRPKSLPLKSKPREKKMLSPRAKEKLNLDIQPVSPVDDHQDTGDREKIESIPPINLSNKVFSTHSEVLGDPTLSVSNSLLTPHQSELEQREDNSTGSNTCPFCKIAFNGDERNKHLSDCLISYNIQQRFEESDKILQEVFSFLLFSHLDLEN
jgi:hypothetical protein